MTCFIARNLLSEYLDGALEMARQPELESHLTGCATCSRDLGELRRVRQMLRSLPIERAPDDFLKNVRARAEHKSILERISGGLSALWTLPAPAKAGVAFAASLALVVVVVAKNSSGDVFSLASAPGRKAASAPPPPANYDTNSVVAYATSTPAAVAASDQDGYVGAADASGAKGRAGAGAGFHDPEATRREVSEAEHVAKNERDSRGALGMEAKPAATPAPIARIAADVSEKKSDKLARVDGAPMATATTTRAVVAQSAPAGEAFNHSSVAAASATPVRPGLFASTPEPRATSMPKSAAVAGSASGGMSGGSMGGGGGNGSSAAGTDNKFKAGGKSFDGAITTAEPSLESVATLDATTTAKSVRADDRAKTKAPQKDGKDLSANKEDAGGAKGGESRAATEELAFGGDESQRPRSPSETPAGPAPVVATGSTATATSPIAARFESDSPTSPADVVDAAKAVGGTVISGTPPTLGKAGVSTRVVIEIPGGQYEAFAKKLADKGTFTLSGDVPTRRARIGVEVLRK